MIDWTGSPLPARWLGTTRPAFVGRRHELAVVEKAWLAAKEGSGQALFIGGEPGAGKSRLIGEVCTELHRLGAAVLLGSCVAELGPPYQPFEEPVEALRAAVEAGTLAPADDRPSAGADVLERLATILGRVEDGQDRPQAAQPGETYGAVVAAVRAATIDRPLVLALEDLHWAGSSSLQLLRYLIERTTDCRLLVLVSHRTTAPDRSGDLVRHIAAMYRLEGVRRLDLSPLATEDIAEYLVREGKVAQDRALASAVELRDRTGGNPFFLREIWLDLVRRGGVSAIGSLAEDAAPQVVQDVVQHRVAALPSGLRDVLDVAAVIGEDVHAATLVAIVGPLDGLSGLDALVGTGLMESVPGTDSEYRFVHALARQAILDRIPALQRARHHERVASFHEARDGPVELLAHHYTAARLLGHDAKAMRYLIAAAEVADRRLAHSEAARLFERAAGLTPAVYDQQQLLLSAARSYNLACDFGRAEDIFHTVAAGGHPGLRLRAATAYEDTVWFRARSGHEALRLLTDALGSLTPDLGDPDYVRAIASLGRATAHTGDHERGEVLVSQAITMARADGSEELLAVALDAAIQVGVLPSISAVKLERARELSLIAGRGKFWRHFAPAANHQAMLAYQRGDADALAQSREDQRRAADASGHEYWNYLLGFIDHARSLIEGDFGGAQRATERALELGASFGGDSAEGPYGVQMFMVRRENGGLEKIRPLITGSESISDHWPPALLTLYVELGLLPAAARVARHLLDQENDLASARWPGTVAFLAEAALALGERETAFRVRPLLEPYAGLNLLMGPFSAVFGAADRYIAGLDSILQAGTPDATFAAALALDVRTGSVLHQAQTLAAWAAHRHRVGDRQGALDHEHTARELAQRHGMLRVLAGLDQDRGRPRISATAAAGATAAARPDRLTEREDDVLRLLGRGLSNRDIARELVISENTAANHVRNILAKTGCANRTQAAMYGAAHGLLDRD